MASHLLPHITVQELAIRLQEPTSPLQLIDVREPQEVAIAALTPCIHFPLSEFAKWAPTLSQMLDPQVETIVFCHHGVRSAQMCHWLSDQGFVDVKNVTGGIDAYAIDVDPALARY
ncbi:MAG: rhodanese-like domain-containing protein [Elainellaceae cyanobacterium]